jgi:hypothetical protein
MNRLLKWNNTAYFWGLCVLSGLSVFLSKQFLYTEQLYYYTLSEQFTSEQTHEIITYLNETWRQLVGYGLIPVIIIIRVLYTSLCLFIGNLVNETHWDYKTIFTLSLKSDIAFVLSQIVNFYFYAISDNFKTLDDLGVNCCSLLKLFGIKNIPNWLIFAYNSINLFELLYVVLLVLFIKTCFQLSYFKSTVFVLLTYCIGNYLFIIGMTFLYLNFS